MSDRSVRVLYRLLAVAAVLVVAVIGPDGSLVRLETGPAARSWGVSDLLKTMYSHIPPVGG